MKRESVCIRMGSLFRPPKSKNLGASQANTCLLGVASGWGPSWVWA